MHEVTNETGRLDIPRGCDGDAHCSEHMGSVNGRKYTEKPTHRLYEHPILYTQNTCTSYVGSGGQWW